MEKILLFNEKKDCCGCGACANICPKNAISMVKDEYGFLYPQIDSDKCIACGACKRVCSYQNHKEETEPLETYVAITKNTDILKSASGGIFASFATEILAQDGIVFGASFEISDGKLTPMHIGVKSIDELIKLQGSKYVQSEMNMVYRDVKRALATGQKVLFSGTPCQIAALKSFLGNKEYDNLLTVDIICHGVPSCAMFQDYLDILEKSCGKIYDFKFRDKVSGWGLTGSAYYYTKKGKKKKLIVPFATSSYYSLFLESDTYRVNCYSCKYANSHRVGDITIGDYWGIENEHPDILMDNGGCIDETKGVSCLIVNSQKGQKFLEYSKNNLYLVSSEFNKVRNRNGQLQKPSEKGKDREYVLNLYKNEGYEAIEKWFRKKVGFKWYVSWIKSRVPVTVKKRIKKLLKRIKD